MITIKGELTDHNTFINAERSNKFIAAKIKKDETRNVQLQCLSDDNRTQEPITKPCEVHFMWYTRDLRKDPDNVSFAKKFVLDGLVKAGILKNDTRMWITGLKDDFGVDPSFPRVEITLI